MLVNQRFINLLDQFELGSLALRNRVVMILIIRSRATPEGVVGKLVVNYDPQRASMDLLLSEEITISAQAVGSPFTPDLHTET